MLIEKALHWWFLQEKLTTNTFTKNILNKNTVSKTQSEPNNVTTLKDIHMEFWQPKNLEDSRVQI